MYINTTGLVLREATYRDSSKILTVLTSTEGKLTVSARGVKRRGSRLAAAAQPLAYSHMTLFRSRDRWTLTEAQTVELFSGLSRGLHLLALGAYVAELLEAVSDEDSPNPEILALGLNTLFLLSDTDKDPRLLKAAFELRLLSLAGYAPAAGACAACGRTDMAAPVLELFGGVVRCRGCAPGAAGETARLDGGALEAVRHIVYADSKKIFSFALPPEGTGLLASAAEKYTCTQLDRGFKTLDYYKSCADGPATAR